MGNLGSGQGGYRQFDGKISAGDCFSCVKFCHEEPSELVDAVMSQDEDRVAHLFERFRFAQADLDQPIRKEQTLVHMAVQHRSYGILELLLENGATPDVQDERGATPLMQACLEGDTEAVTILLDYGSNVDGLVTFNQQSRNSLRQSLDLGASAARGFQTPPRRPSLDESSTRRQSLDSQRRIFYQTPLHVAARRGFLDIAQLLLERGADTSVQTRHRETAAFLAVRFDHKDVVRLLVSHDPDCVDERNINGDTLLIWACLEGHRGIARFLLKQNFDINAVNLDGLSPLLAAVRSANTKLVSLILRSRSALVDNLDNSGTSALLFAASRGLVDICRELLIHGADPSIADRRGRAPKSEALAAGHPLLVQMINTALLNYRQSLQLRCWTTLRTHLPDVSSSLSPNLIEHLGFLVLRV